MEKVYIPSKFEEKLYKFWEKKGFFKPNNKNESFCIVIPPPNITGNLHMGHAFQHTIIDILIRYNRMKGKNTLWQVGTDHAGIATQVLVERKIYDEEKKLRTEYNRSDFLRKVWLWTKKFKNNINSQMRRLGNSVDWDRERFTLDEGISQAVKTAFIELYNNKLIIRRKGLVNWDFKLRTVISDIEVNHISKKGYIWYIRYPLLKDKLKFNTSSTVNNDYIIVATTRPETLLGDTAIAVNPNDDRYKNLIGRTVSVPIINRYIPIVSDKYVDINKGTGCVKITPAHDFNDYQLAIRHKLPMINIFTFDGNIKNILEIYDYQGYKSNIYDTFVPLKLHNLSISDAKKYIIKELEKLNLLDKFNFYEVSTPYGDRSNSIIQPMLTDQWYLKVDLLSKTAVDAVKNKKIKFIPKKYEGMFFSWMKDIKDWCISRQLWWGHRIPAWYDRYGNIYVGNNELDVRIKNNLSSNIKLKQDCDVLDTWFSSSLWTFASLGWPNCNSDLKTFHPTNVLVCAFDIIFFWIFRMIMLTMYFIKDSNNVPQIPFKEIYITGLIRDEEGNKMSKSKGNIIDPLDIIDGITLDKLIFKRTNHLNDSNTIKKVKNYTKHFFSKGIEGTGTDALRFTFAALASTGRDINWDMNRLIGYKNFCNKLWNASRFVITNIDKFKYNNIIKNIKLSFIDKWIFIKLNLTIKLYRNALDEYRFDIATRILYNFIWSEFCDWYLELAKINIKLNIQKKINSTLYTLLECLDSILKLSHPIIPFITETIWQRIKLLKSPNSESIMLENFPNFDKNKLSGSSVKYVSLLKKIIIFVRDTRCNMNISKSQPLILVFNNLNKKEVCQINKISYFLIKILFLNKIKFISDSSNKIIDYSISTFINEMELLIPLKGLLDKTRELNSLNKKLNLIDKEIDILKSRLLNNNFIIKAPKKLYFDSKSRLISLRKNKLKIISRINLINKL
ncbi:valine--tRNA ligase [Buchnera aphidicola (Neophyllaphis varicolor)]|uniref:valine--tRNA ligase n=1 Tax=Buchnera aphidicola TaxID=9 RepID=UPI0031B8001D